MPRRRGNESVTGIVSLNTLVIHVRENSNLFIVLLDLFIVTDFFLCMVNGFCVLANLSPMLNQGLLILISNSFEKYRSIYGMKLSIASYPIILLAKY
jgi:hypothetical protein